MSEVIDHLSYTAHVTGFEGLEPGNIGGVATTGRSAPTEPSCGDSPAASNGDPRSRVDTDPLNELGPILAAVAERDRESVELAAEQAQLTQRFLQDFAKACAHEVRPTMEAVLERLQQLGGDGLIEEHPGGEPRFQKPSLVLWISLKGSIVGEARADRYPYLLIEADAESRKVHVDEGDMWRGGGGNFSGRVGAWEVSELTHDRVTQELMAIAHRAAGDHLSRERR